MPFAAGIRVEGLDNLRSVLRAAGADAPALMARIAQDGVEAGHKELDAATLSENLVFTGRFGKSLKTSVISKGEGVGASASGFVYSTLPSVAATLEEGRAPGERQPSAQKVLPYVVARFGSFRLFVSKRGKARKSKNADRAATSQAASRQALRVAFAFAEDLQKEGIKPRRPFAKATRAVAEALPALAQVRLDEWGREHFA